MVSKDLIEKFSRAIAREEGFYVPQSVPNRAHNPGDLTDDGDLGYGVIPTAGPHGAKITIYPNEKAGWDALEKKVARMLNGASHTYPLNLTIMEVAIKWSGDPAWARNVAKTLGVDTRTTLAMIADADLKRQAGALEA